nr:zinc finger BED domain-containing protein RICESLEEPER 2-like [Tanacetum cinerariifolium]
MTRDVLAIPISTVASEATFSAGGKVIDPYRFALKSNTVEMFLCGRDWIRQTYGIKKKVKKDDIPTEVLLRAVKRS